MKKTLFALLSMLLCAAMLISFAACDKKSNDNEEDEEEEESSGNTIDQAIQDALDAQLFYEKDKLSVALPADVQQYIADQTGESFDAFAEDYCEEASSVPEDGKIDWEIAEQTEATEDEIAEIKNKLPDFGMSEDKLGDVQMLELQMTISAEGNSIDRALDTTIIEYDGVYYVLNCINDILSATL